MKRFLSKQKPELLLFVFSMILLTFLGIILSYNFPLKNNYNLLFDSDTARVLKDATMIVEEHYRSDVHPLFILLVQPWVHLLSGIVFNKTIAIIIISSFVSSLSVMYLYKILETIKPRKKANLVFAFIYLFSFSNLIFTTGIETYNFAALFLILLWYYFIKKEKEDYDKYSYIALAILGILNFSITITNVCVFLIILFFLWIMKKIKIPTIIKIGVSCAIIIASLSLIQKLIWQNTTTIWNFRPSNEQTFMEEKIGLKNIKEVLANDYYNAIVSSPIKLNIQYGVTYNEKNYVIFFQPVTLIHFILLSIFYILLIFLLARNFKKKLIINGSLLLTLVFNTALHIIYGNESAFLYSLHFLYIMILLLGINFHLEEDRRWKLFAKRFLLLFLGFQIINNSFIFTKVMEMVQEIIKPNFFVGAIGLSKTIIIEGLIILLTTGMIFLGIKCWKYQGKKLNKIIACLCIITLFLGVESIFIGIESTEENQKFLKKELVNKQEEFTPKNKIFYLSKEFKKKYKKEISSLEDYLTELEEFKKNTPTRKVENKTLKDYYYFGMGNRRKLVYRPGKIIDVEAKKVLYTFEEEEYLIIPNCYTVLIHTKNDSYIKIMEDEVGIHYIKDENDEIIKGTNTQVDLYSFENQQYQNMKKELYGEILFNIKDSIIYPNIVVYDKPWYRDAAITSMVLKETNNTDMIKDWVLNIEEIYDKQNSGIKEADNLGELLYIISTQEEKKEDLIRRIEEEAERIAKENPDGYYIYGKTDFGDQVRYQNLWYKLGMESLGKEYPFELDKIPMDSYTNMTWWIKDEKEKSPEHLLSNEYPYLSFAERHTIKSGTLPINENYYPLSYETSASNANYENYKGIDDYMITIETSPLHTWSASELLLYLLEETGNRQFQ